LRDTRLGKVGQQSKRARSNEVGVHTEEGNGKKISPPGVRGYFATLTKVAFKGRELIQKIIVTKGRRNGCGMKI